MTKTRSQKANKPKSTKTLNASEVKSSKASAMPVSAETQPIEETAYEQLLRKVNDKKRKLQSEVDTLADQGNAGTGKTKKKAKMDRMPLALSSKEVAIAQIQEDDTIMEIEVTKTQQEEFPSQSEDNEDWESEIEDREMTEDLNNNASMAVDAQGHLSAERSIDAQLVMFEPQPTCSTATVEQGTPSSNSKLKQSLVRLQSFMVKKGLMTEDELQEFMVSGEQQQPRTPAVNAEVAVKMSKGKSDLHHTPKNNAEVVLICHNSPSEVTVYQRAVPSVVADKVGEFLQQAR